MPASLSHTGRSEGVHVQNLGARGRSICLDGTWLRRETRGHVWIPVICSVLHRGARRRWTADVWNVDVDASHFLGLTLHQARLIVWNGRWVLRTLTSFGHTNIQPSPQRCTPCIDFLPVPTRQTPRNSSSSELQPLRRSGNSQAGLSEALVGHGKQIPYISGRILASSNRLRA